MWEKADQQFDFRLEFLIALFRATLGEFKNVRRCLGIGG